MAFTVAIKLGINFYFGSMHRALDYLSIDLMRGYPFI
jgi:hypothetical protein